MWHWWAYTDGGLWARIAIGAAIFGFLGLLDIYRNGWRGRRWREYLFLAGAVAAAMVYGAVNDQITCSISWEYFYYGKGLADRLGTATPPAPGLRWEAAKVGLKATWTAGLLIGVALLLANNPGKRPQLSYARLTRYLLMVLMCAIAAAVAIGAMGYAGWPARWSADFHQMVLHNEFRPRRFMCVYGIHLGGYIGGLVGTLAAVWLIRRQRSKNAAAKYSTPVIPPAPKAAH
jgi:hypothetical protein